MRMFERTRRVAPFNAQRSLHSGSRTRRL